MLNQNQSLRGLRVLILQQRGWALRVGHPLAVKLANNHGAVVGAVTVKRSTHEFIISQRDVDYACIISADDVKENPKELAGLDRCTLSEVCTGLGIDTVWRIAQASRNHVSSYRDRYYYGFRQGQPDEEIVNFIKGTYLHVLRCFDEFEPDIVVLPNFAGLQHIMFSRMADKRSIPLLASVDSKVKGVTIFAHDYLGERSSLRDRVIELEQGETSSNELRAYSYIEQNRESLAAATLDTGLAERIHGRSANKNVAAIDVITGQRIGLREYLRAAKRSAREILQFYRRGGIEKFKNLGVTVDYRSPRFILRDNFSSLSYLRAAERYPYVEFSSVEKFVYFPLQSQPEATINVQAPLFTNQIETARQVAMALPDDYCLVVKDHPNMTSRHPVTFIDKIARLPNVKLVSFQTKAEAILKRAALLVSPSSSTIAEAALLRVPTIQLGNLGTTALLPNVTRHADFSTLPEILRRCLATEWDPEVYDEKLARYISAAYDVGLDGGYYQLWRGSQADDTSDENRHRVTDWFIKEICNLVQIDAQEQQIA